MLPAGRRSLVASGVLLLTLLGWHPARVMVQALLLLPAVFPSPPVDPLAALSATPRREHASWTYSGGTVEAELFVPVQSGRHGAIILLLGAGDLPRAAPALRFADALARLGIVTLVPESSGMLAERMTFDEVDAVRTSIDVLARRPDVDAARLGLVGLSASGGISIVAAGQPDLRQRVRFVNSLGSYADTLTLLADVASRSDGARSWQPDQRTLDVVRNALDDAGVDAAVRDELVSGASRERAATLLAQLPSSALQRLSRASPITVLRGVRARIYLMHDADDPFIPLSQSRELAGVAPPGVVARYTEFAIFAHVIPERAVPWQTFVPDVWRLLWHVHAVLLEVL